MATNSLWQATTVEAKAWSPEDFTQNIQSGGPPKDGIPSIDRPKYISAADSEKFVQANDIVFLLLYLYSVGNIVIAPGLDLASGSRIPSASIAYDWTAKMWKPIAPFVWEPIAALYPLRSVALFILPNLLWALLLATLVGLNTAVTIAQARLIAAGQKRGFLTGFLASLPEFLTGFTCCVPTFVLALGSLAAAITVAAITIAPYLLPIAALALSGNLLWGLRQFSCAVPLVPEQNRAHLFTHKRE